MKKDGMFVFVALHQESNYDKGVPTLFARSGNQITNQAMLNLPENIIDLSCQNSRMLFQFELKSTKLRSSVFNGAVSPVRKKPLDTETAALLRCNEMWLTDAVPVQDFAGFSSCPSPCWERRRLMNDFKKEHDLLVPEWKMLDHARMLSWADELIAAGEEGVCGYNPNGFYEPGARRADLVIKKAKEISRTSNAWQCDRAKKANALAWRKGSIFSTGTR